MIFRISILLLFSWVIIGAYLIEPPMSGVSNPEIYRIFYFHVPIALTAFFAYGFAMYQAIVYLKKKELVNDQKSVSAAALGTVYCILATLSGSVFAKFTWGSFWNWDPRETSIVVLLLIYLAYFALRSAVSDPVRRANLSAAYSILGFFAAVFTMFIWPRITPGLHPGSPGDAVSGAFIEMSAKAWLVFGPSVLAFLLLFLWLYSLSARIKALERRLD